MLTILVQLIIALVVIGIVWWLINRVLPIAEPFKTAVNILLAAAIIIWLVVKFLVPLGP